MIHGISGTDRHFKERFFMVYVHLHALNELGKSVQTQCQTDLNQRKGDTFSASWSFWCQIPH